MRAIEGRLNALEKQANCKGEQGQYCKCSPPPPTITRNGEPPELPERCDRCGKPYPPNCPRVILIFK